MTYDDNLQKQKSCATLSLSLSLDARLGFLVSIWRHDYLHYQSSLYGVFQRQGLHCHTHTSKRFRFFGSRCHDDGVNRSLNNGGFGAHRWNRQLFFADVQIEIIWSDDHCWQGAIPLVWFSKALKGDQKNASTSFFKRICVYLSYVVCNRLYRCVFRRDDTGKKIRSLEKKITFPGKNIYSPWKRNLGSCGPLVLWSSGPVVLWSSGPVVLWSCGPLAKAWKGICRDQKSLEGVQKEVRKKKKRDN